MAHDAVRLVLSTPGSTHALLHGLERPLGGLVAQLEKALNGLLARRHLLAAHNTPRLVLHKILLVEAAARVLGRFVIHLCLGANCLFEFHFYLRRGKRIGHLPT